MIISNIHGKSHKNKNINFAACSMFPNQVLIIKAPLAVVKPHNKQ